MTRVCVAGSGWSCLVNVSVLGLQGEMQGRRKEILKKTLKLNFKENYGFLPFVYGSLTESMRPFSTETERYLRSNATMQAFTSFPEVQGPLSLPLGTRSHSEVIASLALLFRGSSI